MSTQWLLDIAALVKASRAVARSHIGLRSQQVLSHAQAPTSAATLKDQARLVVDSAGDNEQGPANISSKEANSRTCSEAVQYPTIQTVHSKNLQLPKSNKELGEEKGHFCKPIERKSPCDTSQVDVLQVHREKNEDNSLSNSAFVTFKGEAAFVVPRTSIEAHNRSAEARQSQDLSEASTPDQIAQNPPKEILKGSFEDVESDVTFNTLPGSKESTPTSLRHSRLPQKAESGECSAEGDVYTTLSQDVFHTQRKNDSPGQRIETQDVSSDGTGAFGEHMGKLFRNPRIGRDLLGEDETTNPYTDRINEKSVQRWPPIDRSNFIEQENIVSEQHNLRNFQMPKTARSLSQSINTQDSSCAKTTETVADTPLELRESRVPSSRLGRMWQYAGLGASMTLGAAAESVRRITGSPSGSPGPLMLSPANMERLVAKLSRMRGAALKVGQLLSFQDSKILSPAINQVLQRVQDSADYMPTWQRNQVLEQNLGSRWQELFSSFDERPLAAASIGQVHAARLSSGDQPVVVKIQYPGVANSIDSDLNNLAILLNASRLLPKGLYLDKTIANARTELAWECDYVREAEAAKTFRDLLKDERKVFQIPYIYSEACGKQVLTMERMGGTAVTKIHDLPQKWKDWIGGNILRLCLREITEFKFMQTDPNWTNFLFNSSKQRIELLDFGASRRYPDKFIKPYIRLLEAASRDDRDACRDLSIQLGYLTGMESMAMLDAHIKSVTILAEPFKKSAPDLYDFKSQTVTDRVRDLIPVMLRERLSPPPEETYSLHRKLSGAFLMLTRLGSRVNTKDMFKNAMEKAEVSAR